LKIWVRQSPALWLLNPAPSSIIGGALLIDVQKRKRSAQFAGPRAVGKVDRG
jgi:hypothetical protein